MSEDKKSRSEEALKRIREMQSGRKVLKKLAKMDKSESEINLSDCDLSKTKDVKIKEGPKADLTKAKGKLPDLIDISNFNSVELEPCDLSKPEDVKFKEGSKADLTKVKGKLPDLIDFSNLNSER